MDQPTEKLVLDIIEHAHDLTLATVRPDGYPQATTVSYAHDGLTFYVGVGKESQKAANIRQNNKVSLTINNPYHTWYEIRGLSIGGIAEFVTDPKEAQHAGECMMERFPQIKEWVNTAQQDSFVFIKITPQVMSVLDYTKGFGHTELVTV